MKSRRCRSWRTAPARSSETLTLPSEQQSWRAFERIFDIIQNQGLAKEVSIAEYRAWLTRYPTGTVAVCPLFGFSGGAQGIHGRRTGDCGLPPAIPERRDIPDQRQRRWSNTGRARSSRDSRVYEQSFQPLWAPELVKSYFDLLSQTQSLRKFLDQSRAALNANPEDLNAMARVFYYYQQQGKLDLAQQTVTSFRLHKDASRSDWTGQQLYVCARLLEDIHEYPESARYYFALYNSQGHERCPGKSARRPHQSFALRSRKPDPPG